MASRLQLPLLYHPARACVCVCVCLCARARVPFAPAQGTVMSDALSTPLALGAASGRNSDPLIGWEPAGGNEDPDMKGNRLV